MQRVFKLVPTFEATDAMLADGVHSAQMAYRMGESEFVRRFANRPGFTKESATLAWNRAADTYSAVLTIVADLKALEPETLPFALKTHSESLSSFPNWNNLFKTGNLCECEHCRSVLGPAAYCGTSVRSRGQIYSLLPFNHSATLPTGWGVIPEILSSCQSGYFVSARGRLSELRPRGHYNLGLILLL